MANAAFLIDLSNAIRVLKDLKPTYSVQRDRWRALVKQLEETEAVVQAIEAYAPGYLRAIESAALEEMQVIHDQAPLEVTELIERYAGKVSAR
jgi:hypothetical protein